MSSKEKKQIKKQIKKAIEAYVKIGGERKYAEWYYKNKK